MPLTQIQIDALRATSATLMAQVSALVADSPPPIDPPPPPAPVSVDKGSVALNLSSMVLLDAHVQRGARYVRAQYECFLTADTISLPFHWTDINAGGTNGPLHYPSYSLWLGDVKNRGTKVATGAGVFSGSLGALPDGPYISRIVAHDATGAEVVSPVESFAPFGLYVDRAGKCKDHALTIFQSGSYEWAHPDIGSVQPATHWFALVPKALLKSREVPLAWDYRPNGNPINTAFPGLFAGGEPFNTVLPYTALTRMNYVPTTDAMYMDEHRPSVTKRGITVTSNQQGYSAEENVFAGKPRFPLIDGPRGKATLYAPTALWIGHAGAIYGMDGCAFWRIGKDGTKMTFAGLRHVEVPYWEEMRDNPADHKTEVVGDWDASIPMANRYPQESWGLVADLRTTHQDPAAALVNLPPFGILPPHLGIGPVFYSTCRRGRILKYQFDKSKPNTVPKVTEFVTGLSDPWGLGMDQATGTLYVAERGRHAISMWSADDGRSLGDLLVNQRGSIFGAVSTSADRSWKFFPAFMQLNGLPKWDLARAEPILAPEGCEFQDGYVYWGSLAQSEVRRVNVATGAVEVCTRIPVAYGGQSRWVDLKLSDGSFYPRGTIFTTAFDNQTSGRPRGWLQVAGTDTDGTTLTHSKQLDWQREAAHVQRGPGGRTSVGIYATGLGVGNGMLACGSSGPGLCVFMQATLGEALPDEAKLNRGSTYYREHGHHLVHGNYGYGHVDLPLPFGEQPDMDYFLHWNGH
jgi:hypothetical protein